MKVVSEFLEMEWNPTELIVNVNVGRIHPGTNRKRVGTHSSVNWSTIFNSAGNGFSIAAADLNNNEVDLPKD